MFESGNIIMMIILIGLIIFLIVWLISTLRSINLKNRIDYYVINSKNIEDISILARLEKKYLKIRKKMIILIRKLSKSTNKETEELEFTCDKILFSFIALLIYLIISIINIKLPNLILGVISLLVGYLFPILKSRIVNQFNRKRIEKDLLKAVSLINNSLQSGKSMLQAIKLVSQELDGPISNEFHIIEKDLEKGLSLSTAFTRFQKRVCLEEVDYIIVSLLILNQTGGDMISVFKSLEENFYIRRKLDNELKATIASSKLVFQILTILPLFIYIMIGLWNPTYFTIFFKSSFGVLLFLVIILIYLLYIIIIKSIMKVERY